MIFDSEAFISYAHLDNVELMEGRKGWVANLHRALEVRLAQLLGKAPQIWRDPKLQGNDFFDLTLTERLKRVIALISVVSPRYVKSEWTLKELREFWKAAEEQGGIRLHNKARIFKVMKTPVPLDSHPPELRSLLGYEFFKTDPETGKVRELNEVFGPEAQRDFWIRLDDLAHDICCVVETMEASQPGALPAAPTEQGVVFLAETTSDLKEQREAIKRDLEQHGYTVLPADTLPWVASELKTTLRECLARCRMSIHLVGKRYGLVPEGDSQSLAEIENNLAIERGEQGDFSRLIWMPSGLKVDDERQQKVVEQLRMDPRIQKGADLLEGSLENLKTLYQERLKERQKPPPAPPSPAAGENHLRLYLIYDQRDAAGAAPWAELLFTEGFEVIRPVFEGDEAEIREYHEENLCTCDGALILHGTASECWLRRKMRELQKCAGYGRTKPTPTIAIALVPPRTAEKESFRTHEAMVIPQMDGFSPEPLRPLLTRLRG